MTQPCWLHRAVRKRHRHAIEQASRRWRGGRCDDSARTRREILISTKVSRIYAFLGVEAHATRPDLYARSMRKPLHEYVENLDEVREALRGTPWAADPVLTTA